MKGTDEIRTYSFDNDGLNELKNYEYGKNWPVVYLIHNGTMSRKRTHKIDKF